MRGLAVQFTEAGMQLPLTEAVEFHELKMQNALMNLATTRGSDAVFSDRGTDLLSRAVRDGFPGVVEAQHRVNFATLDTLYFERAEEAQTEPWSLAAIQASPALLEAQRLDLELQFQFLDGKVIGWLTAPLATTGASL